MRNLQDLKRGICRARSGGFADLGRGPPPILIDEAPMVFDSGAPLTSPASRHSLATADGAAAAR